MSRRAQTSVRLAGSFLVWAALIFFLARTLGQFPEPGVWASYFDHNTLGAALVFALFFLLATALRTIRFGYLVRRTSRVSWLQLGLAFPWLFMLGAITPFRLGEGYRAVFVRRHGGTGSSAVAFWFGERIFDLMALAIILFIGLSLAPRNDVIPLWLVAGLLAVGLIGYGLIWAYGRSLASALEQIGYVPVFIVQFLRAFDYMHDHRGHGFIAVMTLAIWLVMLGGFYSFLTIAPTGGAMPVALAMACLGAVNLAALLSAAPANVGSYQAAMVAVMALFGQDAETAFILAVILHSTGLIATITTGSLCWITSRLTGVSFSPPLPDDRSSDR